MIEQARQQGLPFRGKVTWGVMDHGEYERLAGNPSNARGLSMIWGALIVRPGGQTACQWPAALTDSSFGRKSTSSGSFRAPNPRFVTLVQW